MLTYSSNAGTMFTMLNGRHVRRHHHVVHQRSTTAADAASICQEIRHIFGTPRLLGGVVKEMQRTIPKSWKIIVEQVQAGYAGIIRRFNSQ